MVLNQQTGTGFRLLGNGCEAGMITLAQILGKRGMHEACDKFGSDIIGSHGCKSRPELRSQRYGDRIKIQDDQRKPAGAGRLFLRKGNFVDKLLIVYRLNLHVNAVRFSLRFILADSKRLPSL